MAKAAAIISVVAVAAFLRRGARFFRPAFFGGSFTSGVAERLRSRTAGSGLRNFGNCELIRKETLCETRGEPVRRLTFSVPEGSTMNVNTALRQVVLVPACSRLRMYSPTTEPCRADGTFDLIVRVYRNGLVSRWLDTVPVGDSVPMVWPWPAPLPESRRNPGRRVGLVAYGIGITELYRVAANELADPSVEQVVLLYATRTREEQRVLEPELTSLLLEHPERFRFVRTLSQEQVEGFRRGRVDREMLADVFPWVDGERGDVRFLPAGSGEMMDSAWAALEKLGYPKKTHSLIRDTSILSMLWGRLRL